MKINKFQMLKSEPNSPFVLPQTLFLDDPFIYLLNTYREGKGLVVKH